MRGIHAAVIAAGSQAALARAIGTSEVAIHKWVKQGWVPKDRAVQIEQMFGVPRSQTLEPKLLQLLQG